MGDRSERNDRAYVRQAFKFRGKELTARGDLRRLGLVLRRYAAHGVDDAGMAQDQPVIDAACIIPFGETEFQQSRVEQVAGEVAGERAPCTIGAAQPRRQTDNQKVGVLAAPRRDWSIMPIRMGDALCCAKLGKARAEWAVARRG